MAFIHTNDILSAWVSALSALTTPDSLQLEDGDGLELEEGGALACGDEPFFQDVRVYSNQDVAEALKRTLAYDDRVCFLVPSHDAHTSEKKGFELTVSRITQIGMILLDRNYNRFDRAALTGSDTQLGTVEMKDQLLDLFTGQDLGLGQPVRMEPGESLPVLIVDSDKPKLKGREAWSIDWQTDAGKVTTRRDRMSGRITSSI